VDGLAAIHDTFTQDNLEVISTQGAGFARPLFARFLLCWRVVRLRFCQPASSRDGFRLVDFGCRFGA
jgi:hypothetical protein